MSVRELFDLSGRVALILAGVVTLRGLLDPSGPADPSSVAS